MWQCPGCFEELEDTFGTCWKCGMTPSGQRDPAFQITETPDPQVDQPAPSEDEQKIPRLELPAVSYFAIPCFIAYQLARLPAELRQMHNGGTPGLPMDPLDVAVLIAAMVLIVLPGAALMLRGLYHDLCHKRIGYRVPRFWGLFEALLPTNFRAKYPWFVPIYYVSLIAYIVGPIIMFFWHLAGGP